MPESTSTERPRPSVAGPSGARSPAEIHALPAQDWRILVAVFWIASFVEGAGVSQIFALQPTLLREMGVADADRRAFIGLFSALTFVIGAPLVPLWGAWADKYSRKAVIVRSALVAAAVFAGVALSREPWQLAVSMLLIGFQLGNTGVMLAAIRDVAPRARLGTVIALFGVSSPIGFAVGPVLAAFQIDGLGWPVPWVFWFSSLLSLGSAAIVTFGSKEVRPEVVPAGRVVDLAFGAVRNALVDPAVRRIFLIFGVSYLGTQMCRPYIPLLVEGLAGIGPGLASSLGLVVGTAALVGALVAPLSGAIGDRVGFRPVLIGALGGAGVVLLLMPFAPTIASLAVLAMVLGASTATVSAMVFSLLATEVPPERRSATLNLVYLPLYAAGIVGPAISAIVAATAGVAGAFILGGAVFVVGAATIVRRRPSRAGTPGVTPDLASPPIAEA